MMVCDGPGILADKNSRRRDIVRTRTAQYLRHAEELHQKHLSPKTPSLAKASAFSGGTPWDVLYQTLQWLRCQAYPVCQVPRPL